MTVGVQELAFVFILFAICVPLGIIKRKCWIAFLPLFFVVAMCTTPADLISLLMVGIPNAVIGGLILSDALDAKQRA